MVRSKIEKVTENELEIQWTKPEFIEIDGIRTGDMPGDKVQISQSHIEKANVIVPELLKMILPVLNGSPYQRVVISVHGGSGVGKSEIGSLLAHYFNLMDIGSYVMSGDNYPHRIPFYNDAERKRIFTNTGLKALVSSGEYTRERYDILVDLQKNDNDANLDMVTEYPWLSTYQRAGRENLADYLGSDSEIDFDEVNRIISDFKNGYKEILLKRMGREVGELWYDSVDFTNTNILIIEWTHGNNKHLKGVDVPILLNSTPLETLEHRKARNRDGATDSGFTTMVLDIEQKLLHSQAANAKIIITKSREIVTYEQYLGLMK